MLNDFAGEFPGNRGDKDGVDPEEERSLAVNRTIEEQMDLEHGDTARQQDE